MKRAGSGHLGSSFSAMDIVAFLLFEELNTADLGWSDEPKGGTIMRRRAFMTTAAGVALTSSVPASGDHLSEPVELDVDIANEDNATGWTYRLDGKDVQPGDLVGPGLAAGEHTLVVSATDVFGKEIAFEIDFTSDAIPTGGGTDQGEGKGTVQLSAIATSPEYFKVVMQPAPEPVHSRGPARAGCARRRAPSGSPGAA
mgnify:CR=1 FL=1